MEGQAGGGVGGWGSGERACGRFVRWLYAQPSEAIAVACRRRRLSCQYVSCPRVPVAGARWWAKASARSQAGRPGGALPYRAGGVGAAAARSPAGSSVAEAAAHQSYRAPRRSRQWCRCWAGIEASRWCARPAAGSDQAHAPPVPDLPEVFVQHEENPPRLPCLYSICLRCHGVLFMPNR